jgi:hypothetical protein
MYVTYIHAYVHKNTVPDCICISICRPGDEQTALINGWIDHNGLLAMSGEEHLISEPKLVICIHNHESVYGYIYIYIYIYTYESLSLYIYIYICMYICVYHLLIRVCNR